MKAFRRDDGFTLIDMLFVVGLVGVLSSLAIPGMMRAKTAAQSASALGTVRVVGSAQLSYAITCGLGFYAPDFPTLTVKPGNSPEAWLGPEYSTGPTFIKHGYNFSMAGTALQGAPGTCNGLGVGQAVPGYALVADQLDAPPNGAKHYGTNADGVIYVHTSSLAATMPEGGAPPQGTPIR